MGGGASWCRYGQIVLDIGEVLHGFDSWQVCHMKKGANKEAHTLAKEGLLKGNDRVWFNVISDFLIFVLNSELHALVV
jgi:hypothetical protein